MHMHMHTRNSFARSRAHQSTLRQAPQARRMIQGRTASMRTHRGATATSRRTDSTRCGNRPTGSHGLRSNANAAAEVNPQHGQIAPAQAHPARARGAQGTRGGRQSRRTNGDRRGHARPPPIGGEARQDGPERLLGGRHAQAVEPHQRHKATLPTKPRGGHAHTSACARARRTCTCSRHARLAAWLKKNCYRTCSETP